MKERDVLRLRTRNLNVIVSNGRETLIMVWPCENNGQNMDHGKDTGIKNVKCDIWQSVLTDLAHWHKQMCNINLVDK